MSGSRVRSYSRTGTQVMLPLSTPEGSSPMVSWPVPEMSMVSLCSVIYARPRRQSQYQTE